MSCKIKDLCERIGSGGTPSRKNKSYYNLGNIKWLKTKELDDIKIYDTEEKITEEGLKKSSAKLYPKDTIVMAMYGATVGKLGIIKEEMCTNQACCNMVVDSNKCNYKFLYYSLLYNRESIINLANGAAQQNLSVGVIGDYEINLPSLEEQEKIADILSSLDDKVELNNEMNKTLEEMAQSIFKRWFVDFEFPNEDGKPYKSSGGEMVDSELGMIPKGWEVKKISELIEVKDGTHASPKVSKEGFPLVTSKHIKGDRIAIEDAKIISEKDYLEVNKRSKVDTGDILISMIGTVGLTYFVQEEEINFAIKNIGLFKTSQNKTLSEYFYLYLKSDNMKNYIEARLAGTTQKYISLGELRNIPVVLPNDSIIDKFKKVVGVLLDKRRLNIINNEELMITRDTLLPKLMNGEIMI